MPFVVAVDFGGTKMAVATATRTGEIIAQVRLPTEPQRGADQAVERALDAARDLVQDAQRTTGDSCLGAGVVCPGIPRGDGIDLAPNVPGWEELALPSLIREGLGLEAVAVGNDARAAALAEHRWGALAGADPGLFINLGTGISGALLVGGEVVAGAHGAAGEIGYMLLGPGERRGYADGGAPLEELAGGRFLGLRASELQGRALTTADAFADPDRETQRLVDRALDELAVQLANLALLADPERVAIGGGIMASAERVLAALGRRMRQAVPFPPELVKARFSDDGALRGAMALVLDHVGPGRTPDARAATASRSHT